ncbi:hypothetical protein BE15_19550 [Sorangium cellulosum]|uniref:Uncharacterized protein n=1 Tax=Sorangium cellulosum TaxID=56 RepID=A0A150QPH0_SORCE|nr:hypothetical protein BE15_19550 [Sorangium cellulosum]
MIVGSSSSRGTEGALDRRSGGGGRIERSDAGGAAVTLPCARNIAPPQTQHSSADPPRASLETVVTIPQTSQ